MDSQIDSGIEDRSVGADGSSMIGSRTAAVLVDWSVASRPAESDWRGARPAMPPDAAGADPVTPATSSGRMTSGPFAAAASTGMGSTPGFSGDGFDPANPPGGVGSF